MEVTIRDGHAQLTYRDNPPRDLPRGLFHASGTSDSYLPHIDHADPRLVIAAELLAEMAAEPWAGVSLTLPEVIPAENIWTGATLKIRGSNRMVIYRIGEYVAAIHGYVAEWPD